MKEFDVKAYIAKSDEQIEQVGLGPGILGVTGQASPRGSLFGALMRQENTVGSFLTNRLRSYSKSRDLDPNFKWWEHIPEGRIDDAAAYAKAQSIEDIEEISFALDYKHQDQLS